MNISLRDRVILYTFDGQVRTVELVERSSEGQNVYKVYDPDSGEPVTVPAEQVLTPPSQETVLLRSEAGLREVPLLGLRLEGDIDEDPEVLGLLVRPEKAGEPVWVGPRDVAEFELAVAPPKIETGLTTLVQTASWTYFALAIAVFPTCFILTSLRWHWLLKAAEVKIGFARTFALNMVGLFYNSFMPGSTGGDVLKAYYASKHTVHGTRAVITVLVDRVLGLLTLVMLGGTMAAVLFAISPDKDAPAAEACRRVALTAVVILAGFCGLMLVAGSSRLRGLIRFDSLMQRLPAQRQVASAWRVFSLYKRQPTVILSAVLVTVPVHLAVVAAGYFSGIAIGLDIPLTYYVVAVPVMVLMSAIPISPQGAGVMEFFAVLILQPQGATVSEAFALALCIRLVHILWNLTGGLFVLRGGYSAPSVQEQAELEAALDAAADDTDDLPGDDEPTTQPAHAG